MHKKSIGAAIVVVLLVGFGAVQPVHAAPLGCGAVITANTTLTADVGPCNQGGLVVRGNGVTLDLGGHTVFGKPRIGDGVGVLLDHVTGSRVTHGTVMSFDAGVEVLGGGSNSVDGITAKNNVGGAKSSKNLGDGITIQQSSDNAVSGNIATGNGPFSGISIVDDATNPSVGSDGNTISGNQVVGNNVVAQGVPVDQDDGIRIEGPNATNTVIANNRVAGSGLDGIAIFADQGTGFPNSGSVVAANNINGNGFHNFPHRKGDGVILFGAPTNPLILGADETTVESNNVANNAADGIAVTSQSNSITSNTAQGNAAYPGVTAWDLHDGNTTPPCDSNTWSGNTFGTSNQSCIS
ncbi:MAG TPA: NosD domain-containing protein [Candidatus Dormibacteraeota bacterium]